MKAQFESHHGVGNKRTAAQIEETSRKKKKGQLRWRLREWIFKLDADTFTKSLLHVLVEHVDEKGVAFPGVNRIASRAGMSPRKAQTLIKELAAGGYFNLVASKGGRSNTYIFADPALPSGLDPAQRAVLNPAHNTGMEKPNPARQVAQPRTDDAPTPHTVRTNIGKSIEDVWLAREEDLQIRAEDSYETFDSDELVGFDDQHGDAILERAAYDGNWYEEGDTSFDQMPDVEIDEERDVARFAR